MPYGRGSHAVGVAVKHFCPTGRVLHTAGWRLARDWYRRELHRMAVARTPLALRLNRWPNGPRAAHRRLAAGTRLASTAAACRKAVVRTPAGRSVNRWPNGPRASHRRLAAGGDGHRQELHP